jgi:hypothetical protein
MSAYSNSLTAVRSARTARDKERDGLYKLRLHYLALKKQQKKALSGEIQEGPINRQKQIDALAGRPPATPDDPGAAIDQVKKDMAAQKQRLGESENEVSAQLGNLFAQLTPQQLIGEWDATIPILLLPLRLETKYKNTGRATELWVRVYPDDIAVVTHEKVLTQQEIDYGTAYWKALFDAGTDEGQKKTAWLMMTDKFGASRSAWAALQTKPLNWGDPGLVTSDGLQFPVFDLTKPDSWTEAPHTRMMPDRFVLMGYQGKDLVYTAVGSQVPDILVLGPSPLDDTDNPSLAHDPTTQKIVLDEDFKWVADFERAVQNGLGFKIPAADAARGFSRLLVAGIKLSADEQDGKTLTEDLLNNHHYSREGLSLVKQGTPTNNTEEQDSGYSKKDPFQDLSYLVETGQPLFQPVADPNEATDGQRLADHLGLDYGVFQFLANSDARDHTEAVAMNKALYAATLGYYTHSMLNQVMDENTLRKLRDHFTNYVTGRGPLSAIRVGNQPYGLLVTSDFSKWKYDQDRREFLVPPDPFLSQVYGVLSYLQDNWSAQVGQLAHISKTGDAGANLLEVLGLQPTAAEYYQRVGYSADSLKNVSSFMPGGKYFWDVFQQLLEGDFARQILKKFGYKEAKTDGSPKPTPLLLQLIFQHFDTQLDNTNLIDGTVLSEAKKILPYDKVNNLNYIDWLLANAGNSPALEKEDFGTAPKPHSLLYLMLKHALLNDTSTSIYYFLAKNSIVAEELIRSRKYMNISSAPNVSHWEVFQAPVNKIVATEPSAAPLYEYIHSSRFVLPADHDVMINLSELKWGLKILKDMSTAALERVFAEHTDTLSYRLDAWQTSLFQQRLEGQRQLAGANGQQQRKTGIYIGAYGYLENVKQQQGKRTRIPDDTLPPALQEHTDNLYVDSKNGGYVHTSSMNHATAAAILRNGYLTHATPADGDQLSVNLSSERVRRAKYLVDGIRNGQSLEVLLGYQFERGLHDWTTRAVNPVILAQLIPDFRKAFPIKKTKVPQEGNTTGPEETVDDYHVVNGLTLAQLATGFPYGISGLPPLDATQTGALDTEKKNIADTLDALRDLLTSESAYQLALGNFERAAAVLQAVSDSHIPPDIEVIRSARGTDLSITNRVTLHFDSTLTGNPWPGIFFTQKADMEPAMNQWAAGLLGDPAKIRCRVSAVDKDGNILTRADHSAITGMVALSDLQIQALDLLYLMTNRLEASGTSELETRIRYFFAQQNSLTDETIVRIEFAVSNGGADATIRSFAEILPFAYAIRKLISTCKTLTAGDYQPASKEVTVMPDNPDNINVAELQNRVEKVFAAFDALFTQLASAISDALTLKTGVAVHALRDQLRKIADAGYAYAFPQSAMGFDQVQIDALVAQGQSQQTQYAVVKTNYADNLAKVNDVNTVIKQKISLLTGMMKSFLGADYIVLPRFGFNNIGDVTQAYASRAQLLQYAGSQGIPLPVDEWLHGVSLVRPKMHVLETIRILNDNFNDVLLVCEPVQLPYRDKDSWLAIAYPEETSIDHDTLSFIQYNPQGFDAAKDQCGLLIDEWTESMPNKEEVTGITFNYDQPNSVPPQALLLAMSPRENGNWVWDDLASTLLDTFDRSKRRAVEPDMVDKLTGLCTLLPALMSEFSTGKNNLSLDLALNIKYVLDKVISLNAEIV